MKADYSFFVSVIVVTYNQEKWIKQTLDSIVQQKTQYPFEIIIGEDCSTDHTPDICQTYADSFSNVILLKRKKNMGCVPNWVDCAKHASGKYLMMLDGDDYWHNPNKIQLQVDYMESHPNCILCHTDLDRYYEYTGKLMQNIKETNKTCIRNGNIQKDIFQGIVSIASNSTCFRRESFFYYVPVDKFVELGFLGIDFPTWVFLAAYGEITYIPISTYTYRVGQVSLTNNSDYNWIKHRYKTEQCQVDFLVKTFPNLGEGAILEYYDNLCSHQLLLAAYNNNDYKSAQLYARQDKMPDWKTLMAHTWLTFQIARWLRYIRKK